MNDRRTTALTDDELDRVRGALNAGGDPRFQAWVVDALVVRLDEIQAELHDTEAEAAVLRDELLDAEQRLAELEDQP